MTTILEMQVNMDCPGCESKIRKALHKLDGVDEVEIDMGMQKVTVMGLFDQEKVLKVVRRSGRRAELWPFPYNPEYHDFARQYYDDNNTNPNNYNNYEHNNYVTQYDEDDIDIDVDNYYHRKYYYNYDWTLYEEPVMTLSSGFSYNYYKHGYEGGEYGIYQKPPYAEIVGQQASSLFSDDNTHACSIM